MKWLGHCLAARSVDFINYGLSRQRKVVASNSATSLTRNVSGNPIKAYHSDAHKSIEKMKEFN